MGISFNDMCSNVLPEGVYKVVVTDIKRKVVNNAQTEDLIAHYTVVDGKFAKKTLIDNFYRNAFSFRLLPFLNAVDVDTNKEFATTNELLSYGIQNAKNKELMVEVSIKTYNNNKYNEVKTYSKIPGSVTSVEEIAAAFGNNTEEFNVDLKTDIKTEHTAVETNEPILDFSMGGEYF